jgi:DNA-binding NarL/FixJ family response regulator
MEVLMNVIISTDSSLLYGRLSTIFSELPDVNIIGITKDLDEAETAISKNEAEVFITAFHNIQKTFFTKLKEIKKSNNGLIVIVLNNNPADQYLTQWKNAGADYVFDQAMHFNKVIDVLSGLIYKNLLENLKSSLKANHTIAGGKNNKKKNN